MRILFIGDVVGRSGRHVLLNWIAELIARLEARSRRGQRRERRRRLRHHRGDLQRDYRCRRRRGHARQSFLGPARGAGVHRARAAADPPAQLSARHARPGHGHDRCQERRARAGHQRDGAHFHGSARRSVRRDRAGTCRLSAEKRRRRHHHRLSLRGDQREAGDGLSCRRPRQSRGRHPHPRTDRRSSHPAGRHCVHVRCRHDRRLPIGDRHGQGRAAWPRSSAASREQVRAGHRACDAVRRSRSRPTMRPAWPPRSARCGSAACWKRPSPHSGPSVEPLAPPVTA